MRRRRPLRDVAAAAGAGPRALVRAGRRARRGRRRPARPVIAAAAVGVVAGVIAGMLGVGGGSLFVPALVLFVGLGHLEAEATSLLAIVPVALVGAWRQHRYGNVRAGDAAALGALATAGAVAGVVVADAVPERALEIAFAGLLLYIAFGLVRRRPRTLSGMPAWPVAALSLVAGFAVADATGVRALGGVVLARGGRVVLRALARRWPARLARSRSSRSTRRRSPRRTRWPTSSGPGVPWRRSPCSPGRRRGRWPTALRGDRQRPRIRPAEHRPDRGRGRRAAEQVALHGVAAERRPGGEDGARLDALGDDPQAEVVRELDRRADDRGLGRAVDQPGDEARGRSSARRPAGP